MGERRTSPRGETLKVTSAVGIEPLPFPEDPGIFYFPLDSTTIMDNVSHLCFSSSGPEEGLARKKQQVKLEKLLVQVSQAAPGQCPVAIQRNICCIMVC